MRNMWVSFRGGSYSRAGTALVARSKQTTSQFPPRLIPFQFNSAQGYILEFGLNYIRVFFQGAPVVDIVATITNVSKSNPCIVTAINSFSAGDWVVISGVIGVPQVDGQTYIVAAPSGTQFALHDLDGNPVDSTGFGGYVSGGTAGRILTVVSPYSDSDVALIKYAQSADVMSLTHPSYPPYDLARISGSSWTLTQSNFGAAIAAPASCTGVATVAASGSLNATGYAYEVTAVSTAGEESIASPIADIVDGVDIAATAGSNVIDWSAVAGAAYYNIYRAPVSYNTGSATVALPPPAGSLFGYVGTGYGNEFVDSNITPDYTQVPPLHLDPFALGQIVGITITAAGSGYTSAPTAVITTGTGTGFVAQVVVLGGAVVAVIVLNAGMNYIPADTIAFTGGGGAGATATLSVGPSTGTYPGVVTYFQQRRVYAASNNQPDTYWMSRPGKYLNFDAAVPTAGDDAITGTPWGQQVNGIQFMLTMQSGLIVMTGLGAWLVGGAGNSPSNPQPITPASQQATQQAFRGISSLVQPIPVNYDVLYVDRKQSYVYDITYNFFLNNYTGADLTELSSHLFNNYTIIQWTWCESPYKIAWAVRSDNTLLSLTYLKEQEVNGWARHDTFGNVVACASVTEPPVDALYLVVQRFPASGGGGQYYIERMDDRLWQTAEDPWCVDSGLALSMPEPAASVAASSATGAVTFTADAAVFDITSIGKVLRMGGGIATISAFTDTTHVSGTWNFSPSSTIPDLPSGPFPKGASQGDWTLTAPVTTVGGLSHLEGLQVTGLADGIVIPLTIVTGGEITLPFAASNVKVGLPFNAQLQTVYLDAGQPTLQGRRKTVTAVTVRVDSSYGMQLGTNQVDGSTLSPPKVETTWVNMQTLPGNGGTYTSPAGQIVTLPTTGDLRVSPLANWAKPGQVAVQQTLPRPLNVVALIPEFLPGDVPEVEYEKPQGPQKPMQEMPGSWRLRG